MPKDAGMFAALKVYLDQYSLPVETLSYAEVRGFMFALARTPELVKPSEWMPMIFGPEGPDFESEVEAQTVLGGLVELYNETLHDVRTGASLTIEWCTFRDDLMANLEPDSRIAQ